MSIFLFAGVVSNTSADEPPLPWAHQDIGNPIPGGVDYNSATETYSVTADGLNIWSGSDSFHYMYQPARDDCEMVARVVSIGGPSSSTWRKAGVMIRETLDPNSVYAFMAVTPTSSHGLAFQYRDGLEPGDTDSEHDVDNQTAPYWVKIKRVGNTFYGYHSPDGQTWTLKDDSGDELDASCPVTFPMAKKAYIGLALTSNDSIRLCTAVFDNIGVSFDGLGRAYDPSPGDGEETDGFTYLDNIYEILEFTAGDNAVKHTGYFSDNEQDVIDRVEDANIGQPPYPQYPTRYYIGLNITPPYRPSLVRGTWYYWCVDETDSNGVVCNGDVGSFYVQTEEAAGPDPRDGEKFVSLTPTLSWGSGVGAEEHDIYFGFDFNDVNDASVLSADPEYRGAQLLGDEDWQPVAEGGLTLDYLTDYYWRIDEVRERIFPIEPGIVVKGDVWKFTTRRAGGGLRADFHVLLYPEPSRPYEVRFGDLVHTRIDPVIDFHWDNGQPDPCVPTDVFGTRWIGGIEAGWTETYTFYVLTDDGARLWVDGQLIIDAWWAQWPTWHSGTINLVAGEKYSILLEYYNGGGAGDIHLYWSSPSTLREIVPNGALYPPHWAYDPDPSHGVRWVDPTEFVECTWTSGDLAAEHRVYWCVGDDPNALALVATKPRAEPNYDPGPLAFGTSYCWRVDEVNGTDVWEGDVWKFSTVREAGMGSILVERWLNLNDALAPGNNIDDLKLDPRYLAGDPDESHEVPRFDSGTGLGDNYGGRMHGWLIPDTTGDYRFWLATDGPGELWLNPDGPDPFGAELIAYIYTDNYSGQYEWFKYPWQDSNDMAGGLIHLEADQEYYICALWKEDIGDDHCVVAWQGPDQPNPPVNGSDDVVIDGYYLMPFSQLWASDPKPCHRQELSAEDVTLLSWKAGINATTHDIYFGTSPNDVNESATPVASGLAVDVNYYNPGPLEWQTTYYWRIDEVNDTDVWTGGIWRFRTTNYAILDDFESYLYTGDSNDPNGVRYVWKDGWSFFPTVKSGSNLMLGGIDEQPRPYLHYDAYNPHPTEDQGMVFYYDNDGNTSVPGWPDYVYTAPKYSEIEAATTGPNSLGVGRDWLRQDLRSLSLWFRGHPARDGSFSYAGSGLGPYTATITSDGADIWDVGPNPYHDEFHYAYQSLLGSGGYIGSADIIARVDSVENTNIWAKAGVMMRESLAVDSNHAMVVVTADSGVSFQYRDVKRGAMTHATQPGITAPHWVRLQRDSWGVFYAYHANDAEQLLGTWNPVVDATSSQVSIYMVPNIYVGLAVTSRDALQMCTAQFSGVEFQPDTLVDSNVAGPWQSRDIGIISNDPEPLYVVLQDTNNVGIVEHSDPNAALIETWTEWNIDLNDANFAALDMHNIDRIYIGLGDRNTPTTGGKGVMYFDDIRLYLERFIWPPPMPTNLFYDGVIDEKDLKVIADGWLKYDYFVPTSDPGTANLTARYQFEGYANDSVFPYYNGLAYGTPTYSTDSMEGTYAIELTADTEDYIVVGGVGIDSNDSRTIAGWAKAAAATIANQAWTNVFGFTDPCSTYSGHFDIERRGDDDTYCIHVLGNEWNIMPLDEEWHHLAATYDGTTITWYGDGEFVDSAVMDINTVDNVQMGKRADNDVYFSGKLDDVHIYNRALTDPEVAYIADTTPLDGQLYVPLVSPANIYDLEAPGLKAVNLRDFGVLANDWLKEDPSWHYCAHAE
jgi:hypothetical protein